MRSLRMVGGWRRWGLALCLFMVMWLGALSVTTPVLRAQESPLATAAANAAQVSPLPTAAAIAAPTSPLANAATAAAPAAAPLAGTALGSPGVMAALVIVGLVVVGSVIWQYRWPRTKP